MTTTATVTVLFCDLVGSTERQARLGDDAADEFRARFFMALRAAVSKHRGEEVKNLGDGLMVVFRSSAVDAIGCALDMHDNVGSLEPLDPVELRVGLSAGEVASEGADWFGTPVVEAARLCSRAESGETLATDVIRALVGSRGTYELASVGAIPLKGLPEPVQTVAVRRRDPLVGSPIVAGSPLTAPVQAPAPPAHSVAAQPPAWPASPAPAAVSVPSRGGPSKRALAIGAAIVVLTLATIGAVVVMSGGDGGESSDDADETDDNDDAPRVIEAGEVYDYGSLGSPFELRLESGTEVGATFTVEPAQRVAFRFEFDDDTEQAVVIAIESSDGAGLFTESAGGSGLVGPFGLPGEGEYEVTWTSPAGGSPAEVSMFAVPEDPVVEAVVGEGPVEVGVSSSGQRVRVEFEGEAAGVVRVEWRSPGDGNRYKFIRIYDIDEVTEIGYFEPLDKGESDPVPLGEAGTYVIEVTWPDGGIGEGTIEITDELAS